MFFYSGSNQVGSQSRLLLLTLVVCLFFASTEGKAAQLSLYLDNADDLPILKGEAVANNIAGETSQLLYNAIQHIPSQLDHMSYKRAKRIMLKSQHAVCTLNKIKTRAREEVFLFSHPMNFYMSRKLYVHEESLPLAASVLNERGEIKSLEALFEAHKNSLLIISDNISYGAFLDQQLDKVAPENKLIRGGSDHFETVQRMFVLNRVDFLIDYPAEIHNYQHNENSFFPSFTIAGSPKFILGRMMCNNTEGSRKIIKKVNKVLLELYRSDAFLQSHYNYLPMNEYEETRNRIQQYLQEVLTQ